MGKNEKWFIFLFASFSLISSGSADYEIPRFKDCIRDATTIVDAEVTRVTSDFKFQLSPLNYFKGSGVPVLVEDTYMSCDGRTPGSNLKVGKRYIIFLRGADLYEDRSYFEISKKMGREGCRLDDSKKNWIGVNKKWISLEELKKLIMANLELNPAQPGNPADAATERPHR